MEWLLEMDGLDQDMEQLASRMTLPSEVQFLIMGDFNLQPDELGGALDTRRQRAKRFSRWQAR